MFCFNCQHFKNHYFNYLDEHNRLVVATLIGGVATPQIIIFNGDPTLLYLIIIVLFSANKPVIKKLYFFSLSQKIPTL